MKILIISRSTIHHFSSGGMETHLKNLVEGLALKGHKVQVVTTSYPSVDIDSINSEDKSLNDSGVDYIFIGDTTPGQLPLSRVERFFIKLGVFNRKIKEGRKDFFAELTNRVQGGDFSDCDVILSQSTVGRSVIRLLHETIPSIVIIHGTNFAEIKNRFRTLKSFKNIVRFVLVDLPRLISEYFTTNKLLFRDAKYIVAVSNDLKEDFLDQYPPHSNKTVVIRNGVDEKYFVPGELKKHLELHILYVGRIVLEKGIDTIIRVARVLMDRNVNFVIKIVGGGSDLHEMKELLKELGVSKNVFFEGEVKNNDIVEFYQDADLFLFPSRRIEGHPMTISEAMLCGLPIVTSRNGGLKELIEDGQSGYYIDEKNPIEIAEKIIEMDSDRPMLKKLSENARNHALKNYSSKAMVEQYNFLIEKAVNDKNI